MRPLGGGRLSSRIIWTTLVLIASGWVVWRVTYVRRTSVAEIQSVLEISLTTTRNETGAWWRRRDEY